MLEFTTFWCFRINALSRKVSRLYNARCSEYGVTAPQTFVIFDVNNNEGTSVKDIAARIELDSSAITGIIDRLAREGLLERQEDPEDRRSLKIYLTPKGRKLADEKLVPMAIEFNRYIREMVEPEISGIFQHSLDLIDRRISKSIE